jgi:HK97 family phage prohead protease
VEPRGAEFKLPLPLLWQHRHDEPIGRVTHAKATAAGIEFRAEIADIDEPGKLKDRLTEVWQSIKADLVRGISIGFAPLEWKGLPNGGQRFTRWAWHELSVVTLPCNVDCNIATVKAADQAALIANRAPVRVVKLDQPIAKAFEREALREVKPAPGLKPLDDLIVRTIAAGARTTDQCLSQLDERVARLEQAVPTKSVLDMSPDEYCDYVIARRRGLLT